jgi:uncharacterized phosphosugar-binding protein
MARTGSGRRTINETLSTAAVVGWLQAAQRILDSIGASQMRQIDSAAELFASAISSEALVHVFGSGHSRIGTEEMFPRIGSFPGFHPIAELALTNHVGVVGPNGLRQTLFLEKVEGFARVILQQIKVHPGDAFLLFSSSGVGGVVLEMALYLRTMGVPIVAVTSLDSDRRSSSRHSSGLKLAEVADVVIDNGSGAMDAVVEIPGLRHLVGPTSTIGAVAVVNAIKVATAAKLVARGVPPVVLDSPHFGNNEDADRQMELVYEDYFRRIRRAYELNGALAVPETYSASKVNGRRAHLPPVMPET